jgi:serine/threonine protein kinase
MGEVYRAIDTNLGREVAIKVLPDAFAHDPDRIARFEREAKTLASLNHPNIAIVHGLEKSQGTYALVMELVEGEDLSQRIARGPIPLDEALPIAKQTAEALDAAHEQGVIHRDLKPANIKVTPNGTVKVLDFGLAKALELDPVNVSTTASPTITSPALMTGIGVLLGTATYMSPEQARGRAVDTRSDIWAFGCVLFEMLTGTAAFGGDDVAEVLSAVIQLEPAFNRLPRDIPHDLRRLIERCLHKNPSKRLRHIGDARNLLDEIAEAPLTHDVPHGWTRSRWFPVIPWTLATVLAAGLVASWTRTSSTPSIGMALRRFEVSLPWTEAPNWNDFDVAISPNGTHIAYNCRHGNAVSVCVRALDSLTAQPVADGRDLRAWFFSPDGEWIGLSDDVALAKVSIHGGQPQIIHRWGEEEPVPQGFSWGQDGFILFGTKSGLRRVSASGGGPQAVTTIAERSGVAAHVRPVHLPDGRSALITTVNNDGTEGGALVDLANGSVRDLGVRGQGFVYLSTGWLVFQQGTTVLAAVFDPGDPGHVGEPVPVLENVRTAPQVARDGTLVYIPTRSDSSAQLVWVDRTGRRTSIVGERRDYTHLDLAPDGRRALLNLDDDNSINVLDLERHTRNLLAHGSFPIWSRGGDRVTFGGRTGLLWAAADGSGSAEVLVPSPTENSLVPTSWNPVTGDLAYYDHRSYEIWIRPPVGKPRRFLGAPGRKRSGRFSPDGKLMAFVSDETGEYQVYVTAYPGPGPTVAVSAEGGLSPVWSPDGQELFFRLAGKVMAARVSGGPPLRVDAPVQLFDGPYTLDLKGHQREDIAPDGKSFLMVENTDDFGIVIVQNWTDELKRLVPTK